MNDLATLGIAVDSSPAAKAASDLDSMTSAAERAEDAVVGLGEKSSIALKEVGRGASSLPTTLKEVETSATSAGKAASGMVSPQLINQMNQFEASLRSGAKSTAELEIQRSQLRSLQKANMIDDAEAIKINQRLDKTQQEITKSALQEEKAFDQLMRSIDPTAAKLAKLDRETEDLGRALDKGAIDAKSYSAAIGKIDESIAKLRGANDPIVQTTGAMGKLGLGSRQAREDVVQLGNALASGDWSGAARNIGQIGAEAGVSAGRLAMFVAPIALVVAAVAALAYGFVKGSAESTEFNKALELTGNFAGVSADQLGEMARQVSATVGTTGQAAEALTALASNGKIASESFVSITEAAVGLKEGTGKAVSDTIAEFVKLADEPVTASAALNEQYHYLTASVYAQIAALELQGDHAGAVKLATEAYADAINERTPRILENLSLWERGYNLVAKAADSLKNIGRRDIESEISQAQSDLDKANAGDIGLFQNKQVMIDYYDNKLNMLRDEKAANADIAKYQGEQDVLNQKSIVAMGKVDALTKSSWTNEQKRTEELKEYSRWLDDIRKKNPTDARLNQATIDQNIANIKDKNKDPTTAAGSVDLTFFNDAKNRIAAITAEYQNMEKELEATHAAGIYSDQSYMEQKGAILQQQQVEINAAYQTEIDALEAAKSRKSTTAAQGIQLDQKISDARANMVKAQQDSESKLAVLATNEEGRLKKQAAAVENYIQALSDQLEQTKRQLQLQAAGVGMGEEARRRLQDDIKIQQDYQDKLDKLLAQRNKNAISQEVYDRETDAVRKALAERLQLQKDYYAAVEVEQSNWVNGATAAFGTYLEEARNVAGQTKSAFLSAFDGLEDVLVSFARSGKLTFKSFTDSVIADMARIAAKTMVVKPLLAALTSGGGGVLSGVLGGSSGGAASSTDSALGVLDAAGKSISVASSGFGQAVQAGYTAGEGFIGGIQGAFSSGTGYVSDAITSAFASGSSTAASVIADSAASNAGYQLGGSAVSGEIGSATYATSAASSGISSANVVTAAISGFIQGYKANGVKGGVAAAGGAVGGMYVGAQAGSYFGPIGTAVGAVVGTIVGAAFGSSIFQGDWATKDQGIQLGATGGMLEAAQFEYQKKKGGLFHSNKKRTNLTSLDPGMQKALDDSYDGTLGTVLGLFDALNVELNDGVLDGLNVAATNISTVGKTSDEIQAELVAWFTKLGDSAVLAVDTALGGVDLGGQTVESLTKLVSGLLTVNNVLANLNVGIFKASVSGAYMAEQLAAMAGGLDKFSDAAATYYDKFFSATEKADDVLAAVGVQFASIGVGLPATRDGFRDLVEALDITTESGRALFTQLIGLSSNASAAYDILEQRADAATEAAKALANTLAETLNGAVTGAMGAVQRAVSAERDAATKAYNARVTSLNDMVSTATESVSGLTSVGNDLSAALKALRGDSDDAVKMLRAQAQATLQSALATARSGGSLSGITGLSDALDTVSNNNTDLYGSMEDFARDQGRTANVVAELNILNGKQLTTEEQLLASVQDQIKLAKDQFDDEMAKFDQQLEFAQAQIDALNGVDTSILSVTAAVNAMNAAVIAALDHGNKPVSAGGGGGFSGVGGNPINNEFFVGDAYRTALGRDPDPAGLAYWTTLESAGTLTYAQLIEAITRDAKANGELPGYATGGLITGPGTGTSDSIFAQLSNGEYVMSADAVRMFGTGLLDQMNAGQLPAFATGGGIGESGPQLEVTGPSRIYNANQAGTMRGDGDFAAILSELKETRKENKEQRFQIAKTNQRVEALLQKFDAEGMPQERDYAQ